VLLDAHGADSMMPVPSVVFIGVNERVWND